MIIVGCNDGGIYFYHTKKCYKFYDKKELWYTAKSSCEDLDGNLASIPDPKTNDFLRNLTTKIVWIGGIRSQGNWFWTDQTAWNYVNWWHSNYYQNDVLMYQQSFGDVHNNLSYGLTYNHGSYKAWSAIKLINNNTYLPYICQFEKSNFVHNSALEKLEDYLNGVSQLLREETTERNSGKLQRNQQNHNSDICSHLKSSLVKLKDLQDGPVVSIQKLKVASVLNGKDWEAFLNYNKSSFNLSMCKFEDSYLNKLILTIDMLKDYVNIKQFADGLEEWVEDDTCAVSNQISKGKSILCICFT